MLGQLLYMQNMWIMFCLNSIAYSALFSNACFISVRSAAVSMPS